MRRITMYITDTQIARLQRLVQGRHVSELIRQAIDEFLARMERTAGVPSEHRE
jgi:Arc/MetJ-type ribon-helix-helix transcriptional regulator